MVEQNRKTLRSFYCRDYLWELFEKMSKELGLSMDHLMNEAMRHYARSKDYPLANSAQAAPKPPMAGGGYLPPKGQNYPPPNAYAPPQPQGGGYGDRGYGAGGGAAAPHQAAPAPSPFAPPPPVAPPQPRHYEARRSPTSPPPPIPQPPIIKTPMDARSYGQGVGAPSAPPMVSKAPEKRPHMAPPLQGAPPPAHLSHHPPQQSRPMQSQPTLYIHYNGQRHSVSKEQYVIGRGSQMTDLTIRDGNISRKHCVITFRGGQYYIKDLGSTNGIEYQGNRIDSKRLDEGDVLHLCEHELYFTYKK